MIRYEATKHRHALTAFALVLLVLFILLPTNSLAEKGYSKKYCTTTTKEDKLEDKLTFHNTACTLTKGKQTQNCYSSEHATYCSKYQTKRSIIIKRNTLECTASGVNDNPTHVLTCTSLKSGKVLGIPTDKMKVLKTKCTVNDDAEKKHYTATCTYNALDTDGIK